MEGRGTQGGDAVELTSLRRQIERRVRELNARTAVHVKFLESGDTIAINEDVPMETMSVIKVAVFVELMRMAAEDPSLLSRSVMVDGGRLTLGTGVLRKLDPLTLTIANAAHLMLVESDNSATDLCLEAIGGPDELNARLSRRGYPGLAICGWARDWFRALAESMDPSGAYRRLTDGEIAQRGYPVSDLGALSLARRAFWESGVRRYGSGTAAQLGRFLEEAWVGAGRGDDAYARLIHDLAEVTVKDRIARDLIGCRVYNKSGSFDPHVVNDAGIVVPERGQAIIVVVLINGYDGRVIAAEDAIADIADRCISAARSLADLMEIEHRRAGGGQAAD